MSIIETITDVDNTFLSRRELTCNFTGLGGKLKKLESVDMINKEFNLDGKVIIPMGLKTHVGKSTVTGTFFVYDDRSGLYDDISLYSDRVFDVYFMEQDDI